MKRMIRGCKNSLEKECLYIPIFYVIEKVAENLRTQTGNKRLFIIEAIKRGNKIINNILAKHKNPNFSKDLEINVMIIVLNFFNIFLLLSDCCLL